MNSLYPGFEELYHQVNSLKGEIPPSGGSERILIWRGPNLMKLGLAIETALGLALSLRGAEVGMVYCDGSLSGCVLRSVKQPKPVSEWHKICPKCSLTGKAIFSAAGLGVIEYGSYLTPSDILHFRKLINQVSTSEYFNFRWENVRVGALALSATHRYYLGCNPEQANEADQIKREYLFSALVSTLVSKRIIEHIRPTRIIMLHGTYVEWGPIFDLAIKAGIPVTRYMVGYERDTLYFKTATSADTRHLYKLNPETEAEVNAMPFDDNEYNDIARYMQNRQQGKRERVNLFKQERQDPASLKIGFGFDKDQPLWCIFPHLSYDSVFFTDSNMFPTHTEWMLQVLKTISVTSDINWLIKIHPAERVHGVVTRTEDMIKEYLPELPGHIRIIPSDSDINPYDLMQVIDGGVTNYGTVGLELTTLGKPVIISGLAHYANKGFTHEAATPEEYLALIKRASSFGPLSDEQVRLAFKYAHLFMLRRQIPFQLVKQDDGDIRLAFDALEDIKPGNIPILDFLCERILTGGEFILNRELTEIAVQRFIKEEFSEV